MDVSKNENYFSSMAIIESTLIENVLIQSDPIENKCNILMT